MTNLKHLVLENKEKLYKATVLVLLCTILSIIIFRTTELNEQNIRNVLSTAKKVGELFQITDNDTNSKG